MLEFVIPCLLGLESLVGDEIRKLGLSDVRVENGRVLCRGEARDIARLNINLRCGARVILVLHKFRATDFESLFQGVRAVHWEDWIPREGEFPVVGYSINSTLHSVPACQSIVKKAVVDRLSAAYGIAQFPETGRRYQVRFSIMKDEVTVGLDTSGEGLYKRGYRAVGNEAPLHETMAAAMVNLARYRGRDFFWDPFCGSGTLVIEAAQKALNLAPGLRRRFAAEHFDFVPADIWAEQRQKALDEVRKDAAFEGIGYDIDPAAVALANANAKLAGVGDRCRFEVADVREFRALDNATVLTNPPYGERLGDASEAASLARTLGQVWQAHPAQGLYAITADAEFEQHFGKKAARRRKIYNGMIPCQLYMYFEQPKRERK